MKLGKNTKTIATVTLAEAKAIAEICGGDGHSILRPDAFKGRVNDAWIAANTCEYKSDGTPKGTIDGDPKKKLTGVYTLDILRATARQLGIEYMSAFGRGTEARNITAAIREAQ